MRLARLPSSARSAWSTSASSSLKMLRSLRMSVLFLSSISCSWWRSMSSLSLMLASLHSSWDTRLRRRSLTSSSSVTRDFKLASFSSSAWGLARRAGRWIAAARSIWRSEGILSRDSSGRCGRSCSLIGATSLAFCVALSSGEWGTDWGLDWGVKMCGDRRSVANGGIGF